MHQKPEQHRIATHSIGEGLDFACNLLVSGIDREVEKRPARSQELLSGLTYYISLRYNGEEWLALEALECLATGIGDEVEFRRAQYRAQVEWCAKAMGLRRVDATRFTRDDERTGQK
jgi:hypothetical protein